jgi:surface antigen
MPSIAGSWFYVVKGCTLYVYNRGQLVQQIKYGSAEAAEDAATRYASP